MDQLENRLLIDIQSLLVEIGDIFMLRYTKAKEKRINAEIALIELISSLVSPAATKKKTANRAADSRTELENFPE